MKYLQRWTARQSRDEQAWGLIIEGTEGKPVWVIMPSKELDDQDAALIMAAHNAAVENRPERSIYLNSIVNTRLEPIVEIAIGPEVAHLHVREARQHLIQLAEAIEASTSDSLLCRFVRDYIYHGKDDDQCKQAVGHLLVMFRDFRKALNEPVVEAPES